MNLRELFNSSGFNRLAIAVLVVCIVNAIVSAYIMNLLDNLIHVQLYHFGLQFDREWADPYYIYAYSMYTALGLSVVLSLAVIVVGIRVIVKDTHKTVSRLKQDSGQTRHQQVQQQAHQQAHQQAQTTCRDELKPAQIGVNQVVKEESEAAQSQPTVPEVKKTVTLENSSNARFSCPNCKKEFSVPIVMLNFEGGKTRLLEICPYCSFVIGNSKKEPQAPISFELADADDKLAY